MALDIQDYFNSIGIFSTVHDRKNISIIQVARWNDLEKLYELLYKYTTIFLERKKNKFYEILKNRKF